MDTLEQQTTGRLSQLESELHSQSRSLGELAAVQDMQGQRLNKIGDGVDKLIAHKGENPTFTPSIVMALIGGVFLIFVTISEYISLQLAPITSYQEQVLEQVSEQRTELQGRWGLFETFKAETHYEVATMESFRESVLEIYRASNDAKAHMDERLHQLDDRTRELEQQVSENVALLAERSLYVQNHNRVRHASDAP